MRSVAVGVGGHIRSAAASFENGKVILVHEDISVELGILTSRVRLRSNTSLEADLQMPEVGLIHVAVMLKVTR